MKLPSLGRGKKAAVPELQDAYDESERTLDISEAHRDVVYTLPNQLKQLGIIYMTQMKRFLKQKSVFFLLFLLIMMPVVFFIFKLADIPAITGDYVNILMGGILCAMPAIGALIAAVVCGSMLPQEFNERTVFLSLPLPLSRSCFYFGKFLAGLTLTVGVISAAYGIAILLAMVDISVAFTADIFSSYIVALATMFNFCAFTYMLSAKSKRGSTMLPFVLLLAIIPLVCVALAYVFSQVGADGLIGALGYVPVFGFDSAINMLGPNSNTISLVGFLAPIVQMISSEFAVGVSYGIMAGVAVITGVIWLILGDLIITRRDM